MAREFEGLLQIDLMRLIAEQQQERFLEYDVTSDTATLSKVMNGRFVLLEEIKDYLGNEEASFSRIVDEDRSDYRKHLKRCIKRPSQAVMEIRLINDKQEQIWHRLFMASIADDDKKVSTVMGLFLPIHQEKLANEMVRMQAERDSLTGVYNQKTYETLAQDLIKKNPQDTLFVMIDIDDFKHINETKGHHVGDKIIQKVGEVLSSAVQGIGYAGRIRGDEFSMCVKDVPDRKVAAMFSIRIKDALKSTDEGISFSVSIGVTRSMGRDTDYMKLYHEADEAIYYAKMNGKNQIVLWEEIENYKQQKIKEESCDRDFVEEEVGLDESLGYHTIVDSDTKKILYMNKPARQALGIQLEEAQKMYCYNLFKGSCKECDTCDLFATHVQMLDDKQAEGLAKYIKDGKFILQSRYTPWKGKAARRVSFMNLNEASHVEKCFLRDMNSQDVINKCWSIMMKSTSQDADYVKILELINRYYDADCTAIVTKEGDDYKEIFECHRENAQKIADGLAYAREHDKLQDFEVLINDEGFMVPHHIEKKLEDNPEIGKILESLYVRNTLGIRLMRMDEFVGIMLVVNPRHYVNDVYVLNRVGLCFTTELLRRRLVHYQEYSGTHDMLTRFWNRGFFTEWDGHFKRLFTGSFGVFTSDIYKLKKVNQEFGYDNGNRRILALADIFRSVFAGYSIFRYDDDQMLAVCHEVDQETFDKLVQYAKEKIDELGFEVASGYSWAKEGLVVNEIKTAEDMLVVEKIRLVKEETEASNRYIESDIRNEIQNGNFRVYLQPKVDIHTGKTVGAEALIRLWNEHKGLVPPGYFIPILEERHVIWLIDLFVLREVMLFQKDAIENGLEPVRISLNFSKNTLMCNGLLDFIKSFCSEIEIPEGLIQIEITESVSSMDHMVLNKIAKSLRHMGFSISMDDFGTQYSNMAVLTQFQFDCVKIDRSMIVDLEKKPDNVIILKHMLGMLRDLNLTSVIEGVENEQQVEILKKLGVDVVQGYYYGKPEPKENFYELFM